MGQESRSCTSGCLDRVSDCPLPGDDNTSEILLAFGFVICFCFTEGGVLLCISLLKGEAALKSPEVDMLVDGFRGDCGWDTLRLLLLLLVILDNGLDLDVLGLKTGD